MKRITIVGSGFAAVAAIAELRRRSADAHITVISERAELVYLPSLIWIASGLRTPDDLHADLGSYFRRMKVHHHAARATALADEGRTVLTNDTPVSNDGLIIASGGRFLQRLPGIERAIIPCQGTDAAMQLSERLAGMNGGTVAVGFAGNPDEPSAMRGGPAFEFLFGIHEQLRREGRRGQFKLAFFSPAPVPGKRLGDKAAAGLVKAMRKRDIDVHVGKRITGFSRTRVELEEGGFDADLIVFLPGMTGARWLDDVPLPRSPGGLLAADAQCRVQGTRHVYVAGDGGSYPGPEWMPRQAHMAQLQGRCAAANLLDELQGKQAAKTFDAELMCIIDGLNHGTLVWRTPRRSLVTPSLRSLHWLKRLFEWQFLRGLR